ncbi:MAG: agarase, partial [Planctomycetota bacterium]
GATDRGCLHPGLVIVEDQAERAQLYGEYVNSVADLPAFVGCHWFQYMDEPLTGRASDGENYNVGLVSVADTPYPELLEAARTTHEEIYARHHSPSGS